MSKSNKNHYSNLTIKIFHPNILCIADVPDWIFHRHVQYLQRYLGNEYNISIAFRGQPYEENDFDLIYPLEYDMVTPEQIMCPSKYITGIRSFVSWADWDFLSLTNYLVKNFISIHVVSKQLYEMFLPYIPNLWHVSHGIDIALFSPTSPPSLEAGGIRLGWAGNRKTIVKGFDEYIQPLSNISGIELVFHGFSDKNLTMQEMPAFYNSIDAYICASSFEGNNNSLLESAAMERAIITTSCGTVPEYLTNNHSALIVERDVNQFVSAVEKLRDNPDLRISLGKNARKALIEGGWDWETKSEEYRQFFRNALNKEIHSHLEEIPISPTDYQHFAKVLQTQFILSRELRIGWARRSIGLENELDHAIKENTGLTRLLEERNTTIAKLNKEINKLDGQISQLSMWIDEHNREITEIKTSETYQLVERIKKLAISRAFIWLYNEYQSRRKLK